MHDIHLSQGSAAICMQKTLKMRTD